MKRKIRLNESDLIRIIKSIVKEQFSDQNIKDILLKRVKFLNDYDIQEREGNSLYAKKVKFYKNIPINNILNIEDLYVIPKLKVTSMVGYFVRTPETPRQFKSMKEIPANEIHHTFYVDFILSVEEYQEDTDTPRKYYIAAMLQNNQLKYEEDIITKDGEPISEEDLNRIINNINKFLFRVEEYTDINNIPLF
jgi:hypothetical protein